LKTALILGVAGQDGIFLANYLHSMDYRVIGASRLRPEFNSFLSLNKQIKLINLDIRDSELLRQIIIEIRPSEIYNLAAVSSVAHSFLEPELTHEVNFLAFKQLLDIASRFCPHTKIFQASSSEMFGVNNEDFLNEGSALNPVSPYGKSKAEAHVLAQEYRASGKLWIASGIMFNHESPLRKPDFVTRKITQSLARIKHGKQEFIELGNIDVIRDWGYAGDYVTAMHAMLQLDFPDEFIVSSGEANSLRNFLEAGFKNAGIDKPLLEILRLSEKFKRESEIPRTVGSNLKSLKILKWSPETSFYQLVAKMVDFDMKLETSNEHYF
jgi:GDPmannose 4,6-dehydratase